MGPMRCFDPAHAWQLGWATSQADILLDALAAGLWQFQTIQPLGLSGSKSFIRLTSGQSGTTTMLYVSFRTADGCDKSIDLQFTRKLSVHSYEGDTAAESQASGTAPPTLPTFLTALIPLNTQWTTAQMPRPEANVIIHLVSIQDGEIPLAMVGISLFLSEPSQCNAAINNSPDAVSSFLPNNRCNYNGACESVFGENQARCKSDCS